MATPKLRFKEFDGDWLSAPLKKYFPKIRNGFVGVATPYYVEKGVKYLQGKNVKDGKIDPAGLIYISEEFHLRKNNSKLSIDDILMVQSGHVGECAVIEREYDNANCHALIVLSPHQKQKTNSHFVKYYFYTPLGKKIISQVKTGNTIEHVLASEIKEVELNFPSKEEQTKIASFLSAVDEKISQLTQKHELLSQYKQGMMQKLFSQQLRFKANDGSEFGEWEEVKFSDIFNFHQTNSYSRALLAEYGEIMNIHYGDIHTKFSMLFDVNKESVPFLNDEVDTSKIAKEQFLKVGDLVIADASEDYKDIGKSIEVISLNNQKVVAGLHTYIARPVKPFALGFCGYMMQTFPVREQIKKLATGISVLGISKSNLGKVELSIPCLEEQTKIAKFLSSIDQKIEVVAQQIELAKQWKKGLLQQMFV